MLKIKVSLLYVSREEIDVKQNANVGKWFNE